VQAYFAVDHARNSIFGKENEDYGDDG